MDTSSERDEGEINFATIFDDCYDRDIEAEIFLMARIESLEAQYLASSSENAELIDEMMRMQESQKKLEKVVNDFLSRINEKKPSTNQKKILCIEKEIKQLELAAEYPKAKDMQRILLRDLNEKIEELAKLKGDLDLESSSFSGGGCSAASSSYSSNKRKASDMESIDYVLVNQTSSASAGASADEGFENDHLLNGLTDWYTSINSFFKGAF